jgi:sigma-B regulation protein RsbU (phosphoserine phosphatase)
VSGKGISAAILMAFVRPVMRTALDRTGDPVAALERTNKILVEERPTGLLVTILCGVLDLDTGVFRFANAGHEWPLLVRRLTAGSDPSWVTAGGPLLGAFRSLDLVESSIELGVGDALILYTDGVTDAAHPGGERFGADRFAELVAAQCAISASAVVETVMTAVTAWEGPEPADDLALLVLRRTEEPRA